MDFFAIGKENSTNIYEVWKAGESVSWLKGWLYREYVPANGSGWHGGYCWNFDMRGDGPMPFLPGRPWDTLEEAKATLEKAKWPDEHILGDW